MPSRNSQRIIKLQTLICQTLKMSALSLRVIKPGYWGHAAHLKNSQWVLWILEHPPMDLEQLFQALSEIHQLWKYWTYLIAKAWISIELEESLVLVKNWRKWVLKGLSNYVQILFHSSAIICQPLLKKSIWKTKKLMTTILKI